MARTKRLLEIAATTTLGTLAAAAGAAATVWSFSPRKDALIENRWRQICHYRYAHRGLHDKTQGIPENSLPAFEQARDYGFGAELDVHLTKDGALVVFHDSDVFRMCGTKGIVEKMEYKELSKLHLAGTNERIPLFDEVLQIFEWDATTPAATMPAPIIIELKTYGSNAFALTEQAVKALDKRNVRYVIESFDPHVLLWLRVHRPDIIRGQLAENFLQDDTTEDQSLFLRWSASALLGNPIGRPDFVSYRFEDRHNAAVQIVCSKLGVRLVTWTIRSKDAMITSESEGAPVIFEGFVPGPRSAIL